MKTYLDFLQFYLKKNPDALLWTLGYGLYCHAIDDVVDGDKLDYKFILDTFGLAPIIYSNKFYLENINALYPLITMAHNSYAESVGMERSNSVWQKKMADSLRQQGNEVILAVVEIVNGKKVRDEAALKLREISYNTHHLEDGTPV